MTKSLFKPLLLSSMVTSLLLIGCSNSTNNAIEEAPVAVTGQLVDSYINNVDYICPDETTGVTDINGSFECDTLPIMFRLGTLELGTITEMPSDAQIFPQDLLGVARTDVNNTDVVAMARFLQSCDEDNNTGNGIQVRERVRTGLSDINETFDGTQIAVYADDANITLIDEDVAIEHLTLTTEFTDAVAAVTRMPVDVREALLTPKSTLDQNVTNTLSFMGNEERLAFDVYNKLYEFFPSLNQFTKIATNSEATHIQVVELLAQKYDLGYEDFTNVDLFDPLTDELNISNVVAGEYEISELQNLYDALIAMGQESEVAALNVGCMVEVTDIDDLDRDIALAEDINATDVVVAFNFLRDGSYSHYWSFNKGLVNLGVADGCCALGVIDGVDYCHSEYPVQEQGGGHGHR